MQIESACYFFTAEPSVERNTYGTLAVNLQKLTSPEPVPVAGRHGLAGHINKGVDMLKHIVMWQLKDHAEGADKASNALKLKQLLDDCNGIVPGMLAFEVALAEPGLEATYDVILNSSFVSAAALQAYADHPQHVALKPFFSAVRLARQCMDYQL